MSITAETAQVHAKDPAVLCCRAEAGTTIEAQNLEDPAIFDELVDSGLLDLNGALTIAEILGATLTKTCDSLTPLTKDVVDGIKNPVSSSEPTATEAPEIIPPSGTTEGMVATVRNGKLVISIKEGKDIYLELPI